MSPKSIAYVQVWWSMSGKCYGKFSPVLNSAFAGGNPTLSNHQAAHTWSWLS